MFARNVYVHILPTLLRSLLRAREAGAVRAAERAADRRALEEAEYRQAVQVPPAGLGLWGQGQQNWQILQIFGGLVLGCIKTKFCKKICV